MPPEALQSARSAALAPPRAEMSMHWALRSPLGSGISHPRPAAGGLTQCPGARWCAVCGVTAGEGEAEAEAAVPTRQLGA
jgi:hypothetical protein